jgi:hypothetical protein
VEFGRRRICAAAFLHLGYGLGRISTMLKFH